MKRLLVYGVVVGFSTLLWIIAYVTVAAVFRMTPLSLTQWIGLGLFAFSLGAVHATGWTEMRRWFR